MPLVTLSMSDAFAVLTDALPGYAVPAPGHRIPLPVLNKICGRVLESRGYRADSIRMRATVALAKTLFPYEDGGHGKLFVINTRLNA
ncbi:hypothetical protein N566_02025 [Streptomycetaceae bacterium MP113-05]|nr:hypothetical protein N566_02025 [Streptomycetaceae bacterium MP113-05]